MAQTVHLRVTLGLNPNGITPVDFTSGGASNLLDDAVSYSSIEVTNKQKVVSANVGVAIEHPRVSDLVLTLISPTGQRYLLMENRGGPAAANLGSITTLTNVLPATTSGGPAADTNVIATGQNTGTVIIDYDFQQIPDTMHIYYGGVRIFDSGPINGTGQFSVNYGPGASSDVTIIMNEGDNTNSSTVWSYTATVITKNYSYLTFTENTNLAQVPIKYALPPFQSANTGTNINISDFESPLSPGDYVAPVTVGGWNVETNQVSVVNDPANAYEGSQFLALADGTISRTLPTIAGNQYTLSFAYRGPGIVSLVERGRKCAGFGRTAITGILMNGASFKPVRCRRPLVSTALMITSGSQITRISHFRNALTVESWIYPTNIGGGRYNEIISNGITWSVPIKGVTRPRLVRLDQSYLTVSPNGTDAGAATVYSRDILCLPTRGRIMAATYDGEVSRMYINGVLNNVTPYAAGIFPGTNALVLGGISEAPGRIGDYLH